MDGAQGPICVTPCDVGLLFVATARVWCVQEVATVTEVAATAVVETGVVVVVVAAMAVEEVFTEVAMRSHEL